MVKDKKDVEVSQTSPNSSGKSKEQAKEELGVETPVKSTVTKDVDKETDAVTEKTQNLDKAIEAETKRIEKLHELRDERKALQTEEQPTEDYSDAQKRFLQTEANATIALKAQEDPAFKKRVPLLIKEMQANPALSVDEADNAIKARLLDQIMKSPSGETTAEIPKQINPTAIPETQLTKEYTLEEIAKGKGDYDPAYRQALKNTLR